MNQTCSNSFLDTIMPLWRNQNTWIPLYILIAVVASLQLKRNTWWWLLAAIITVVLTDQISSHIIKPIFARPRPCSMGLGHLLLQHCSGGYSFTSSHACNHFGITAFFIATLFQNKKVYQYLLVFWAATICFAQVYVGVHYPLDVLCGAILGVCIGKITSTLLLRKLLYK